MEHDDVMNEVARGVLQLVLLAAIIILFGIGVNYYVGIGIGAILLYLNGTKG